MNVQEGEIQAVDCSSNIYLDYYRPKGSNSSLTVREDKQKASMNVRGAKPKASMNV